MPLWNPLAKSVCWGVEAQFESLERTLKWEAFGVEDLGFMGFRFRCVGFRVFDELWNFSCKHKRERSGACMVHMEVYLQYTKAI